jgi:hypothetical protein
MRVGNVNKGLINRIGIPVSVICELPVNTIDTVILANVISQPRFSKLYLHIVPQLETACTQSYVVTLFAVGTSSQHQTTGRIAFAENSNVGG